MVNVNLENFELIEYPKERIVNAVNSLILSRAEAVLVLLQERHNVVPSFQNLF